MTAIGPRIVAAAAALQPLGLYLLVSPPDKFVITVNENDPTNPVAAYSTIEHVEEFIADHRRTAATAGAPSWNVRYAAPAPIKSRKPRVTDLVHYVSHGTPLREDGSQAYPSVCRAAMITEVTEVEVNEQNPAGDGIFRQAVSLWVLNPTGQFFRLGVLCDPGTFTGPAREASPGEPLPPIECADLTFEGGTWHWCSA